MRGPGRWPFVSSCRQKTANAGIRTCDGRPSERGMLSRLGRVRAGEETSPTRKIGVFAHGTQRRRAGTARPHVVHHEEAYMHRSCARSRLAAALAVPFVLALAGPIGAADNSYQQRNLVSDSSDTDLVNPWGLAFNPFAFAWVADNGTGKATLYDGFGVKQKLVVNIPGGKPTGIVFSGSPTDFPVSNQPSRFIFSTENGVIAAWSPDADLNNAIQVFSLSEAIFKGLALAGNALAANGGGSFLYATDFHHGKIVVLDSTFTQAGRTGSFEDPQLPAGYAPFGIQNINGDLYVTFAKQDANQEDDVACAGCGFVDVFTANGALIRRVASK